VVKLLILAVVVAVPVAVVLLTIHVLVAKTMMLETLIAFAVSAREPLHYPRVAIV